METILAPLACCLLVLSFVTHTDNQHLTTTATQKHSLRHDGQPTTSVMANSTDSVTFLSNFTESTTLNLSTTQNTENDTSTAATNKDTSQTSQSVATFTPSTERGSLKTIMPSTQTPSFTITSAVSTTLDTTVSATEKSSHTVNPTMDSGNRTTQGLTLNLSEKYMTIIFSGVLSVFVLAFVVVMFQKCRHKIQYMHQPLNSTNETDGFVADEDTLVISGGLYDGHPIYDNLPPTPSEPSQLRLEFLR